jgi:hypothetical protein
MGTTENAMQTTSIAARNDRDENEAILAKQCSDLAWKIVSGPEIPSAEEVAGQIMKLCEQWADGERECCALTAEDHSVVAAMAIRRQL